MTELQALSTAASTNQIVGGYRMSECNSYSGGGALGVSDAYGTALWVIDFLFANAQYGSTGVNLHTGGNGPGYTPIADANGTVVEARPDVLRHAAVRDRWTRDHGGDVGLAIVARLQHVRDRGRRAGHCRAVQQGRDHRRPRGGRRRFGDRVGDGNATVRAITRLDDRRDVLGGAAVGADGSFAPNPPEVVPVAGTTFTIDVPPASVALVIVAGMSAWPRGNVFCLRKNRTNK